MAPSVTQLKEEARRAEKREDWARAIELYRKALRLTEESGEISLDLSLYNRIGDLYRRGGDTDEAVSFYRKAVRQYAEQDLHTGAVALCNKILRLAPDHVDTYRVLGRLHAASGLAAEARNAFEEYAERMEERGDRTAAQDARLELARLVDDDELLVEVLRRMASTGREREARASLAEEVRERRDRPDAPDARVLELAEEMDVADGSGPATGVDEDAEDEAAAGVAPEGESSEPEQGEGPPESDAGDGEPEASADEGEGASGREEPDASGAQEPEEDEDVEGVDLKDILLHDPSSRGSRGEETSGGGEEAGAAPEGSGGGEAGGEPPAGGRVDGDEATAASGDEEPEAGQAGEEEEPEGAGAAAAPADGEPAPGPRDADAVDLGERIRRRLGASPRQGDDRDLPDPGDFDDILVGFRAQAAETSGEADPAAHVELGVALRQMGLLDDAIREFQVAARADDPPLRAFELLGGSFLEKDLHGVAIRVLNRALRLPGYSDHELLGVLYQLGVAYQSMDEHGDALDCFERVYSVDIDFRDVAERMEAVRPKA